MELFPPPSVDATETHYGFFLPAAAAHHPPHDPLHAAEQQRQAFLTVATLQTQGFLWHKQHFYLHVTRADLLTGRTSVGDAIQDEWVVAKLVFDLTRQFPGVIGRISDSDGEFLLIESAEALPEWVTPEVSDRRVFVLNGKLHIAPPANVANRNRNRNEDWYDQDALEMVRDPNVETEASAAVQRLIQLKLDQVPTYVRENRHRVRCLLPEQVAQVLSIDTELVGPAVEAFYYREPKQTGSICGKMETFLPLGGEVMEHMVTFSQAMFAQLKHQEFYPPKPFLKRDTRYRVLENTKNGENAHPDAQAADIGVKLACGLELLYASDGEDQLGKPWKKRIEEAMQQDWAKLSMLPIVQDDDDSWLYMHPDTLESQLQRAAMTGASSSPGGADELQNMAAMFGNFVDGVSGVEGVEGAEPIQFDMSSFMGILNGQRARSQTGDLDAPWGEHFMDEDESSRSDSDDEAAGYGSEDEGEDEDHALDEAMAEMEAELAGTKVAKSFYRFEEVEDDEKKSPASPRQDASTEEDVGSASFSSAKPLDLDYNLLANLLESFASQDGHAGPVSTILNEMNFPKSI